MKKNILAAIVICFLIFACVLAVKEANGQKTSEVQVSSFYLD